VLSHLSINCLRNLTQLSIDPGPGFNLIVGPNGCGKTTLLEAIHLLSLGRSFRTHQHAALIQYEQAAYQLHAQIDNTQKIGVEKQRQTKLRIRINGETHPGPQALAQLLPLRLMDPSSFDLLSAGPKIRRQFLDWMVFHVEPGFINAWRKAQQIIKQRNAALKSGLSLAECCVWDEALVSIAGEIDVMRKRCFDAFTPIAQQQLKQLADFTVNIDYFRGWDAAQGLSDCLAATHQRDTLKGYTQKGPHRADLKFMTAEHPADIILSRGQQKLLILALHLAQGILLKNLQQKNSIYLLDDLAAELDPKNRARALSVLGAMEAQVFITSVEKASISENPALNNAKVFHVEQCVGVVT